MVIRIFRDKTLFLFLLLGIASTTANADPNPTECVSLSGNLDASSFITTSPATPTFVQLSATASFSTSFILTDSLGGAHTITLYFFHTGSGAWSVLSFVDAGEITGGTPGVAQLLGGTTFTYNSAGERISPPASGIADFTLSPTTWANGAATGAVQIFFPDFTQYIASSLVSAISTTCPGLTPETNAKLDFDGDDIDDLVLYRARSRLFDIRLSTGSTRTIHFRVPDATPFAGDFTGDGSPDLVLWSRANGLWFICKSESSYDCSQTETVRLGADGDLPFAADFDGDGKLNPAVYRRKSKKFFYFSEGTIKETVYGRKGDIPVGIAR